ncbi:unnamed protein product [Zymoseptoria tritici ST99CH_3D7]|uniref:Uncharacterized protein n=2 Tax=Zymoseptoria tritici TaxID=1047171 RepID=F9X8S0_ZYMTI|nr:uncharacterized protein MYCGRDRAFT_92321 [Zymoseptoria tritici IPO323]EGP87830.1 hypothetical protein MYCGRDRAFT_92321 [Zymoseptoria tritici IPO323]SMQ49605.1 unnamed protein product [Zymoseptoria tritici ST99CH_3D7]
MLLPRQDNNTTQTTTTKGGDSHGGFLAEIIVASVVAGFAFIFTVAYISLRSLRRRNASPKYLPSQYLKDRWQKWTPTVFFPTKGAYSSSLQAGESHSRRSSRQTFERPTASQATAETTELAPRHSVRSVMTLPAYSRSVRENERVLAREGERDGIDVVIEAPENEAEEEARREAEMESLYQIRVQRRQEIEEREERARRRREARARGDEEELERIRQERILASERRQREGAAAMIAEHQLAASTREARASSVAYADIGLARHDGTRIRANSSDSQRPLLDSAASIYGGGGASLRPTSTRDTYSTQHPNLSRGSFVSAMSTNNHDAGDQDFENVPLGAPGSSPHAMPGYSRRRASTQLSTVWTPEVDVVSEASSRRDSRDGTGDMGDAAMPNINEPPSYDYGQHLQQQLGEEAPPYSSPVEPRPEGQPWRPETDTTQGDRQHNRDSAAPSTTASGAPLLPTIERSATFRLGLDDATERETRT